MTVAELIEKLKTLPQDYVVYDVEGYEMEEFNIVCDDNDRMVHLLS
jgi:hypothetical protein